MAYPRVASLKTHAEFTRHISDLPLQLPCDDTVESGPESVLAQSISFHDVTIGNRFSILPMEGWDGTLDGKPTELTRRRWQNFGRSGAKLIWGGEAMAVRHDGRANPNQLLINELNLAEIESLRTDLIATHESHFASSSDLLVGLQLTHSGRFSKPNAKDRSEPRIAQRNSVLDARLGITDDSVMVSDDDLSRLIEDFIQAAVLSKKAGFQFVDIKQCHGYLGHELLSAVDRPGRFGGSFENRTRFFREIVEGIRGCTSNFEIGVRVSIFDFIPYQPGQNRVGIPNENGDPRLAFGSDTTGSGIDLKEPSAFLTLLKSLGIRLICTTAGSPYYNPHILRPAFFPPSDGYQPPEDPLVSVARQIWATAELKRQHPELIFVGSGYSYLQEWLPHVAQAVIRQGGVDSVGLGRMVLSYPELPADVLAGNVMARKKVCRTFSDCTTAPRHGLVSGCYPLDRFYKEREENNLLNSLKHSISAGFTEETTHQKRKDR